MLSVGVPTTMRKQQHFCTLSTHKKREAQIVNFSYFQFGTMIISLEEKQIVQKKTLHIQRGGTYVCRPAEHTEAH